MITRSVLKCPVVLGDVVVIIAHPLLATASGQGGETRPGAEPVGQGYVMGTEGHASHHAVYAGTAVLTAGLEVLTVLINPTVQLTWSPMSLRYKVTGSRVKIYVHIYNLQTPLIKRLYYSYNRT